MALCVCRKYNSVLLGWEIDELSSTPSHHTPSFAPTDHPYTLSLYILGRSVGEPEGVGGSVIFFITLFFIILFIRLFY